MALPGHGVAHSGPTGDLHTVGQAGEDAGDDGLLCRVLAQPQPAVLAPAQCEHSARVLQTDGVVLTWQTTVNTENTGQQDSPMATCFHARAVRFLLWCGIKKERPLETGGAICE